MTHENQTKRQCTQSAVHEVRRYVLATYIHCEGANTKISMWEIPGKLSHVEKDVPDKIKNILAYFDQEDHKHTVSCMCNVDKAVVSGNPFALNIYADCEAGDRKSVV